MHWPWSEFHAELTVYVSMFLVDVRQTYSFSCWLSWILHEILIFNIRSTANTIQKIMHVKSDAHWLDYLAHLRHHLHSQAL